MSLGPFGPIRKSLSTCYNEGSGSERTLLRGKERFGVVVNIGDSVNSGKLNDEGKSAGRNRVVRPRGHNPVDDPRWAASLSDRNTLLFRDGGVEGQIDMCFLLEERPHKSFVAMIEANPEKV